MTIGGARFREDGRTPGQLRPATIEVGVQRWAEGFMQLTTCKTCNGTRLKKESLWFKVDEKNIADLSNVDLTQLQDWFVGIEERLNAKQKVIAKEIVKEIRDRL